MTQPDHDFRVVLRGYEPAEVDRVIAALVAVSYTHLTLPTILLV